MKECVAVLIGLHRNIHCSEEVASHGSIVVVTPGYPVGLDFIVGRHQ